MLSYLFFFLFHLDAPVFGGHWAGRVILVLTQFPLFSVTGKNDSRNVAEIDRRRLRRQTKRA